MPWVKLSDDFPDTPKLGMIEPTLRPFAVELYIAGLCYSARMLTDGFIPGGHLRRLVDVEAHGIEPVRIAAELVAVGLWQETERGYTVHDFLDYNRSREQVEQEREAWRDRQSRHRQVSREESPCDSNSPGPVPGPVPGPITVPGSHTPSPAPEASEAEVSEIVKASGKGLTPAQARNLAAVFSPEHVTREAAALADEIAAGLPVRSFRALLEHRLTNPQGMSNSHMPGLTNEELSVYDAGI